MLDKWNSKVIINVEARADTLWELIKGKIRNTAIKYSTYKWKKRKRKPIRKTINNNENNTNDNNTNTNNVDENTISTKKKKSVK